MLVHLLLSACIAAFAAAKTSPPENFDPKCADNMQPVFETDTFQFSVPIQTFFNATGPSFFGSVWYTGPVISTTGKDDTVGATRTGTFGGTIFRERLIDFSQSPDRILQRFVLDNGPITVGNIVIASYTEEMVALSICGGTATWAGFTDQLCANNAAATYNLYRRARRTLVDQLADNMGALYFEGSCPVGNLIVNGRSAESEVFNTMTEVRTSLELEDYSRTATMRFKFPVNQPCLIVFSNTLSKSYRRRSESILDCFRLVGKAMVPAFKKWRNCQDFDAFA
ncbi:hypothetical protein DXG01_008071 [Tephrocybe rancida]|nr:hypothetical protein DXG01_008071 [Tephrocybe rancida]